MMGILIEHTGGKWPFWLSPRQVLIVTVAERHAAFAERVAARLRWARRDTGIWVDVDSSPRTVAKKVREAQVDAHNIIVVVGDAEEAADAVTVRFRDAAVHADFVAARAAIGGGGGAAAAQITAHLAENDTPIVNVSVEELRNICEELRAVRLGGVEGV